jgi:TRAP-type uncharacterized transport system fused permease subunit
MIGIFALASGADGWMFKRAKNYERVLLILAGLALVYPSMIYDIIGLGLVKIAVFSQKILRKNE